MPLVSILIPCLQERDFIERCIASVRAFTLPAAWSVEAFVVDGGSTDGAIEKVQAFAKSDSRIHLLHNPRKIQSCAMNIGIAKSSGEYVIRLGAPSEAPADSRGTCIETAWRTGADNVGGRIRARPRNGSYSAAIVQALTTHPF